MRVHQKAHSSDDDFFEQDSGSKKMKYRTYMLEKSKYRSDRRLLRIIRFSNLKGK